MNLYYVFMAVILILMSLKNFKMYASYKNERAFMNAYSAVLKDEENAYETVKNYYNSEKLDYLKNKTKLILTFLALNNNEDVDIYLNDLNLETLFIKKGAYNRELTNRNIDVFIWLSLLAAKAKKENRLDIIDKLNEEMIKYDDILIRYVEYKVFKGTIVASKNIKNEDYDFLNKLINGDYAGLVYDKRLIGIFKRIAATFLAKNNEELDEFTSSDLKEFAKTLVGKKFVEAIDLDKKYLPEVIEETKENKEEKK